MLRAEFYRRKADLCGQLAHRAHPADMAAWLRAAAAASPLPGDVDLR